MNKNQMKIAGIVCLGICVICIFVAIERYNNNANKVQMINNFVGQSPLSGMAPTVRPGTPTATIYATFFAVLSGIGGAVLLVLSSKQPDSPPQDRSSNNREDI